MVLSRLQTQLESKRSLRMVFQKECGQVCGTAWTIELFRVCFDRVLVGIQSSVLERDGDLGAAEMVGDRS